MPYLQLPTLLKSDSCSSFRKVFDDGQSAHALEQWSAGELKWQIVTLFL